MPVVMGRAFQSALARMSAKVSKYCGVWFCAGTLCTWVPAGMDSRKVAQVPVRYVIAERPGRFFWPAGVATLMPEQQPQVQSDVHGVPVQLIGSSLSALENEG